MVPAGAALPKGLRRVGWARARLGRAARALPALLSLVALVALAARLGDARGIDTDLYARWYGLRALFLEGRNPYAPEVTRALAEQARLFGGRVSIAGPPTALETVFGFLYPLPGALLLSPLALLPYPVALTSLLVAQAILLPVAAGLVVEASREARGDGTAPALRQQARALAVPLALCFLPAWANLLLAQPAALVVVLVALALWLEVRGAGNGGALAGGAALAAALALKPHLLALLAPCWLARAVRQAWRGSLWSRAWLAGALSFTVALVVVSLMLVPSWPADFLAAARHYYEVAPARPALLVATQAIVPGPVAIAAAAAGAAALLGWTAVAWLGGDRSGRRAAEGHLTAVPGNEAVGARARAWADRAADRSVAAAGRALVATALLVPPAWETNAVVLLIPLAAMLARLERARGRAAGLAFVAASAALSILDAPLAAVLGWQNGTLLIVLYVALLAAAEVVARARPPVPAPRSLIASPTQGRGKQWGITGLGSSSPLVGEGDGG